jgi:hypothetical protein
MLYLFGMVVGPKGIARADAECMLCFLHYHECPIA